MIEQPDAPKIEFPCSDFIVKVLGENSADYREFAKAQMAILCDEYMGDDVRENISKNGRFVSLSFMITAQSPEHLAKINTVLRADKRTKMVL